jgi:PAS domain S-box-containing protein
MTKKQIDSLDRVNLRRRAEKRIGELTAPTSSSNEVDDPRKLLHELQVYQVELEMQNDELRQAIAEREKLETLAGTYADLYDLAPVGYLTLEGDGKILAANLTVADFVGIERSRLMGRHFERFVAPGSRSEFSTFLEALFTTSGKLVCGLSLLTRGDPSFYAQVEAEAVLSGNERRIVLTDITERKQREKEIGRLNDELAERATELEHASRAKSQFLANMSHELRTPMTGILGMLDLALEGELSAELRGYLDAVKTASHALLRILNDILDFSRIEAGKIDLVEEPFLLHEAVQAVVEIIEIEARRKGLTVHQEIAPGTPRIMVGDQGRIRQVIMNLVSNSVKFTEEGAVTIKLSTGDEAPDGRLEVIFSVADTGIGIPEDRQNNLFRPFTQADTSHSRRFGGCGLGLAITREVVEQMAGTIRVTSKEGVGSTFIVTLPMKTIPTAEPVATQMGPKKQDYKAISASLGSPRLLVAEDSKSIRNLLGHLLKNGGFDFDVVVNGQEAIDLWEQGNYDLILMDVQMPVMDGFEATRAIRNLEKTRGDRVPIIALTAHAYPSDREKCHDAGMDAYVAKPINFENLFSLIRELFASSKTLNKG